MVLHSSNFREISKGKIASNTLYRSNHPICDGKQVKEIILSANNAKINTIINLSDNIHSLKSKILNCPWYKGVYEKNNVIALNMNMKFDILEDKFNKRINNGLKFMMEHEPPFLIHCEAGIDRTGFLSIILESFMEMTFDDIVKDYMLSFVDINDYSLNDYKNGSTYIINTFSTIKGEIITKNENIHNLSTKYLIERTRIKFDELELLKRKLMNN
jgi:protein tyrosine/serine phosphatase